MCYSDPMNTPRPYKKVALFVIALVAVFGAAAALGSLFEPAETEGGTEETMSTHTAEQTDTQGGHATEEASHRPAGLGVAEDGYAVRFAPTQFERGEARELRFAIEADGEPVTEFDELHERRMHLIVVRRDGTQFRHLHPEMDAAGTWSVPVRFGAPGVYRAFADFSVGGEQHTLAGDLFVSGGEFESQPFPAPQPVDETDGFEVRLRAGEPVAGAPTSLRFAVSEGGHPVHDLQPYLGAKGHLVALREGDLAFLHVHPEGDGLSFAATFPTPGRYRLYLQFKQADVVRTVEFTVVVPR